MNRTQFYAALGARLRELREVHRYSYQEIADKMQLGLSNGASLVAAWEQGYPHMSVYQAMQLARLYGVSIMSIVPPMYEEVK